MDFSGILGVSSHFWSCLSTFYTFFFYMLLFFFYMLFYFFYMLFFFFYMFSYRLRKEIGKAVIFFTRTARRDGPPAKIHVPASVGPKKKLYVFVPAPTKLSELAQQEFVKQIYMFAYRLRGHAAGAGCKNTCFHTTSVGMGLRRPKHIKKPSRY